MDSEQITSPTPGFTEDNFDDIFLRAFRTWTQNIINGLPVSTTDSSTAVAIQTIVAQLNYDYNRLVFVIDTILARIYQDAAWAHAAVAAYDTMATSIDPYFFHPELPLNGAMLVQYYLMKSLQARFSSMMAEKEWSTGFFHFLAQLVASQDSIETLTPGIILDILAGMIAATKLSEAQNLTLCFDLVIAVGPFLDSQSLEVMYLFGEQLRLLRKRGKGMGSVVNLAVFGLLKSRELGWKA